MKDQVGVPPGVSHTCGKTHMGTRGCSSLKELVGGRASAVAKSVLVGGDGEGCGFCRLIHEPSAHGGLDIKARILVEKEFNH